MTTLNKTHQTGWNIGFANFLWKENCRWWKTRMWMIQTVIWLVMISGMMVPMLTIDPEYEFCWIVFFVMAGVLPGIGIIIVMQDALIEEKNSGTAAWVLSKPLSRAAFILSKWIANSFGFLVTVILVQGICIYFLFLMLAGWKVEAMGLIVGMSLDALFLLFCLSLALTLSTLFTSRGPVIGISLVALFLQYYLMGLPAIQKFLPVFLILPTGEEPDMLPSLAASAAMGEPLETLLPVAVTAGLIVVFLVFALWQFQREEF